MLSAPFQINAFCPGEHHRVDLCAVVGLQGGGDAPVGNSVPEFDTSILGSTAEMLPVISTLNRGDLLAVLVGRVVADKALRSVGIVEPDDGGGGTRGQVVPRGMEGHAGDGGGICYGLECSCLRRRRK